MWRMVVFTTAAIGLLAAANGPVKADGTMSAPEGSASLAGTVKKVDVEAGTIQVATGIFGFRGKTLQLSEDTLVKVGDREASLTEISEGSKVTAFYETRDNKVVATYIELVPKFRLPEKAIAVIDSEVVAP
jgi:Cu/Ag efflux protein CusF